MKSAHDQLGYAVDDFGNELIPGEDYSVTQNLASLACDGHPGSNFTAHAYEWPWGME